MRRPKHPPTSAAIEAQIRQLETERRRAEIAEDRRRGELLRTYLGSPRGAVIREALRALVTARDRYLFGLDGAGESVRPNPRSAAVERTTEPVPELAGCRSR